MPELPEVESIKLQLQKLLLGHKIEKVEVKNNKIFSGDPSEIEGTKVIGIRRFAKVLSIDLSNNKSLLIHVKLTGQLIYRGPNLINPDKLSPKVTGGAPGFHTHVIFRLDKSGVLYYNDVRRFGWIKLMDTNLLSKDKFIGNLGPEPFKNLTLDYFRSVLSKTSRAVKVVLMDQTKIGGVGNIYANDALFDAKIDPKRPAKSLLVNEQEKLYKSIEKVLKEGIKRGGASELAFVTPDGKEGKYQDFTLVYGKEGKLCKNGCGNKIEKFFLGGRGTYFCHSCQK